MSALVTGFEPFGGAAVNPSEQLILELGRRHVPGITTRVLPTSYRRAAKELIGAVLGLKPQRVLLLGAYNGASALRFEQVALNLDDSPKPDNDGEERVRQIIRNEGPAAYFSDFDFERLYRLAALRGESLSFSRDAGGFVCNHTFYVAADLAASQTPRAQVGFVHVPVLASAEQCGRFVDCITDWLET